MIKKSQVASLIALLTVGGMVAAENVLDEVVVSAKRKVSALQETSVAVTVFSAAALQKANIEDTRDLALLTPNLNIGGDGQLGNFPVVLRGVGNANSDGPSQDSPVAIYVDGVYLSRPYQNTFDFIDLQRVEVLRGPQGTLFGRNASGGAIQFVSKKPGDEKEGKLRMSAESYGSFGAQAYLMTPVSESVGWKIAAGGRHVDGYTRNATTGKEVVEEDSYSVRTSFRYRRDDDVDLSISAYVGGLEFDGGFNNPSIEGPVGPDDFAADGEQSEERKWSGLSVTLDKNWSAGNWTNTLAYNEGSSESSFDSDSTALSLVRLGPVKLESEQYSLESRFSSDSNSGMNWIAGVYLFGETGSFEGFVNLGSDLTGAPVEVPLQQFDNEADTTSVAVFGEVYFDVSDRLTLTGGLRYTRDSKDYVGRDLQLPTPLKIDATQSWSEVTPRIALDFRATEDVFVYASISQGYRSGTWTLTADDPTPADPETVLAYELGLKSDLLNDTLRLNIAGFHYDYEDKQERVLVTIGVTGARNAATATISGMEAEFTWLPAYWLQVFGSLAYLDAEYDQFIDPVSGADFSGNTLIRAPVFQSSLIAEVDLPFADGHDLTLRTEYAFEDDTFFSNDNVLREGHGGFENYNLSLIWYPSNSEWGASVYGQNLGDNRHRTAVQDFDALGLGNPTSYARPRTWGVSVNYDF